MSSRPRNFSEAVEQLGKFADNAGSDAKSRIEEEIHNLQATIDKLKPQLEDLARTAGDEAAKAKNKVQEQVEKNPWAAVGIVGLIFFVLGFLLANKSRRD